MHRTTHKFKKISFLTLLMVMSSGCSSKNINGNGSVIDGSALCMKFSNKGQDSCILLPLLGFNDSNCIKLTAKDQVCGSDPSGDQLKRLSDCYDTCFKNLTGPPPTDANCSTAIACFQNASTGCSTPELKISNACCNALLPLGLQLKICDAE